MRYLVSFRESGIVRLNFHGPLPNKRITGQRLHTVVIGMVNILIGACIEC